MERSRMIGSVDNFDGQQNLQEWIQMVNRAAEFAGWTDDATFKAAMFRLRGEAGEHAEQLKSEGKITSWPELQVALKDRFETAGKEQWHQFLLNTGTQGSKTVQEWAQTVRMLSLRALGSEPLGIKEEGEEPMTAEQKLIAETAQKEARKNLLDFMRRTNFVRGLRSNLRQMVWRRKCKTFDDAVKTAAEEEAVEASHREEEVLSCYVKGFPEPTTTGLVEKIVAALEMRDEERKEKKEKGTEASRTKKQKPGPAGVTERSEDEYEGDEDEQGGARRKYYPNRATPRPNGNSSDARPQYREQLPLPRQARFQNGPTTAREWRRAELPNGRRVGGYDNQARRERDLTLNLCFNCHRPGHRAFECPTSQRQQGNGYRRLY
ncbi:hypothetical protein FJT64_020147 [Amphibalanus amphitrite]|uniref:CCHC-type domain-containing protein n=1 Tax=Amphibalanus amphitrite TaxID=1232801 RepID=A0A6A4WB64_AMPAM|nr:hypothetical protein FJT64_024790 [Amphibalanus amphitrite]KAF0303215.1 hypothetical protein FJT64_024792 [Amphibalanus amphitrite]KAF0308651.1 hypothetical protein FJT64_020147 [Amphibalanus amphitrite]